MYYMDQSALVLQSIEQFGEQLREGYGAVQKHIKKMRTPRAVCVVGMGGSGLSGELGLALSDLPAPAVLVHDAMLPAWVGRDTLVIALSYSGETREVLAAVTSAIRKRARVVAVTTGGTLGAWCSARAIPCVTIPLDTNPAGQPRLGLGLMFGATLGVFCRRGLARVSVARIHDAANAYARNRHVVAHSAQKTARDIAGMPVAVLGAEHLSAAAHAMANQMNETAKQFAAPFVFPELEHHALEGFGARQGSVGVVMLTSASYHVETTRHISIARDLLDNAGVLVREYGIAQSKNRLAEVLEAVSFGAYVSYFAARENRVDPLALPTVTAFKQRVR